MIDDFSRTHWDEYEILLKCFVEDHKLDIKVPENLNIIKFRKIFYDKLLGAIIIKSLLDDFVETFDHFCLQENINWDGFKTNKENMLVKSVWQLRSLWLRWYNLTDVITMNKLCRQVYTIFNDRKLLKQYFYENQLVNVKFQLSVSLISKIMCGIFLSPIMGCAQSIRLGMVSELDKLWFKRMYSIVKVRSNNHCQKIIQFLMYHVEVFVFDETWWLQIVDTMWPQNKCVTSKPIKAICITEKVKNPETVHSKFKMILDKRPVYGLEMSNIHSSYYVNVTAQNLLLMIKQYYHQEIEQNVIIKGGRWLVCNDFCTKMVFHFMGFNGYYHNLFFKFIDQSVILKESKMVVHHVAVSAKDSFELNNIVQCIIEIINLKQIEVLTLELHGNNQNLHQMLSIYLHDLILKLETRCVFQFLLCDNFRFDYTTNNKYVIPIMDMFEEVFQCLCIKMPCLVANVVQNGATNIKQPQSIAFRWQFTINDENINHLKSKISSISNTKNAKNTSTGMKEIKDRLYIIEVNAREMIQVGFKQTKHQIYEWMSKSINNTNCKNDFIYFSLIIKFD